VAQHLTVTSRAELGRITLVIHDAYFDSGAIVHDEQAARLVIPFEQEHVDWTGEPPWEHVRTTWLYDEYRVPFMTGRLTIHHVTGIESDRDWAGDGPEQLVSMDYDEARGRVTVDAWSKLRVTVERLEVEAHLTDEMTRLMRRRTYRFLRAESDRPV
jgi:hypothetical protein